MKRAECPRVEPKNDCTRDNQKSESTQNTDHCECGKEIGRDSHCNKHTESLKNNGIYIRHRECHCRGRQTMDESNQIENNFISAFAPRSLWANGSRHSKSSAIFIFIFVFLSDGVCPHHNG